MRRVSTPLRASTSPFWRQESLCSVLKAWGHPGAWTRHVPVAQNPALIFWPDFMLIREGVETALKPSPVSVPAHVADEALGEVGTDAIQLLRGRQGVKSQLLHVGFHQPILKESGAGHQGSRSQKASGAQTVSAASRL